MSVTHGDLVSWAGVARVTQADPQLLRAWLLPDHQKSLLVETGVPVVDKLIERVVFQSDQEPVLRTSGSSLYRLTEDKGGAIVPGLVWFFGAEPRTGEVRYVLPGGENWFANSSIERWLETLDHYGRRLTESAALANPDDDEQAALAELELLAVELRRIDAPAFADYSGHLWPQFLDRWLY